MSLIHWNKSVLSFHLKEVFEDGPVETTPALLGLGVLMATTVALPRISQWGKPLAKAAIKTTLASQPQPRRQEIVEAKFPKSKGVV